MGRRWRVGLIALTAGLACGAGPQTIDFNQAIDVWIAAAVSVDGTPDRPVFRDCVLPVDERVTPEFRRLAAELQRVSGHLISELADEMHEAARVGRSTGVTQDTRRRFLDLVRHKPDWTPAVLELVQEAVVRAGMTPAAPFRDPAPLREVLAEGAGFEPAVACATPVFKTGSLNRSDTPPAAPL